MVLIILTIQHMKNISVSNKSLCLRKACCDRELRQGWERQPPQAQTDVEQVAEAIQPPHAVAEHGFAARGYSGQPGCRPNKNRICQQLPLRKLKAIADSPGKFFHSLYSAKQNKVFEEGDTGAGIPLVGIVLHHQFQKFQFFENEFCPAEQTDELVVGRLEQFDAIAGGYTDLMEDLPEFEILGKHKVG